VYVLAIDTGKNRIVVGEDEALRTAAFEMEGVNWISVEEPPAGATGIRARVKIRHKHEASLATVETLGRGRAWVTFDVAQRAITPGQAAVIYDDDVVLAGGWIK
jgi:tRNA-specific 2-thiouridylase